MFPNPQDAVPLPPRPNLEQYKKLAKDLVKACKGEDPEGLREWASEWIVNLVRLSNLEINPGLPVEERRWVEEVTEFATRKLRSGERKCTLADAQFVIARSHGFMSWPALAQHIEHLARKNSPTAPCSRPQSSVASPTWRTAISRATSSDDSRPTPTSARSSCRRRV